jgi:soluble P-type ATPase
MIEVAIPGYRTLQLEHLVLDYNGTLAVDGEPMPGVTDALKGLAERLEVHVLTADTFGQVRSQLKDVPCKLSVLPVENQDLDLCRPGLHQYSFCTRALDQPLASNRDTAIIAV